MSKVEIYCGLGVWTNAGIDNEYEMVAIKSCEDSADGYRYYFDDEDRIIYRMRIEVENMSTSTIVMKADVGELITDMFKSVYVIMQHPGVVKVILVHNGTEYTVTKKEVVK